MCVALLIGHECLKCCILLYFLGNLYSHNPLSTAMQHQIREVSFLEDHPIKPHASVLVSRPANYIPFLSCDSTMEVSSNIDY